MARSDKAADGDVGDVGDVGDAGCDLATNRAGAMLRARAVELRRQAPVRTFIARLLAVHTEERDFRIGADGERVVGWCLRELDPARWHVIHSVPIGHGASDIDHVVVGPPGVFTLNTKNHPGGWVWVGESMVLVNGQKTWYIRNSRFEARRAARMLTRACGFPVEVRPVIVVVGARLTIRRPPPDVAVVEARTAVHWLRRQPVRFTPDDVAAVFGAARRPATWRGPP